MNNFFQGFNLDTLLALISCITGIVALFLGGSAYHNCKEIRKSFNDKKSFGENGVDNSQKAAGDIINNNCDLNALATLTNANFSVALGEAYRRFEKQAEENLKNVIEESNRIIREKKLDLSGYTKIDWINIYFESAKNAADTYMQNVWAEVLAKELESPGTFGYKTLDVLKNMSKEDFILFEKLCSVQVGGALVRGKAYKKHGLDWMNCIKLGELGLLSLNPSERTDVMEPRTGSTLLYGENCIIWMNNNTDQEQKVKSEVFLLTYAAKELSKIVRYEYSREFMEDVIEDLKEKNKNCKGVSFYLVDSFIIYNN